MIQGSRLSAQCSWHHSLWLPQGLLSKFIKGKDSQPNRCRNVRGSFTCHIELMNFFLHLCETGEFIQHSFIQQVCTEWLWCTWHHTKHQGAGREGARPLETCPSRHRRLVLDLERRGWEQPGADLTLGKTRGFTSPTATCLLCADLHFFISDLETPLKHANDIPIQRQKTMPSATSLSAVPKIISPTVHAHSDLLSHINSSSNDRFFGSSL